MTWWAFVLLWTTLLPAGPDFWCRPLDSGSQLSLCVNLQRVVALVALTIRRRPKDKERQTAQQRSYLWGSLVVFKPASINFILPRSLLAILLHKNNIKILIFYFSPSCLTSHFKRLIMNKLNILALCEKL